MLFLKLEINYHEISGEHGESETEKKILFSSSSSQRENGKRGGYEGQEKDTNNMTSVKGETNKGNITETGDKYAIDAGAGSYSS